MRILPSSGFFPGGRFGRSCPTADPEGHARPQKGHPPGSCFPRCGAGLAGRLRNASGAQGVLQDRGASGSPVLEPPARSISRLPGSRERFFLFRLRRGPGGGVDTGCWGVRRSWGILRGRQGNARAGHGEFFRVVEKEATGISPAGAECGKPVWRVFHISTRLLDTYPIW